MKIVDITITDAGAERGCLVSLDTDAGPSGVALGPAASAPWLLRLAREHLMGEDPRAAPALYDRLSRAAERQGPGMDATVATLDTALWDLKAKAAGEPLWRALGADAPRAPVYATLTAGDFDAQLRRASGDGMTAVKLVSSDDRDADADRLVAASRALSTPEDEAVLLLDGDAAWDAKEAAAHIQWIERRVDLTWVEDPRPGWDFLGLRRVGDAIRGAVCSGGGLAPGRFLALLHHRAANVVEIDLALTGVTGALRIADAALAHELPITLAASPGDLHVHVAAALSNVTHIELSGPDGLPAGLASGIHVEAGCAVAGDAPGIGLSGEAKA